MILPDETEPGPIPAGIDDFDDGVSPTGGPRDHLAYLAPNLRRLLPGQTMTICRPHREAAGRIARSLNIPIRMAEVHTWSGKGVLVTRLSGGDSSVSSDDPSGSVSAGTYPLLEVHPHSDPPPHIVRFHGRQNDGKVNLSATLAGMAAGQVIRIRMVSPAAGPGSAADLSRIKSAAKNAKVRIRITEYSAVNTTLVTSLGPWRQKIQSSVPPAPRERCFKSFGTAAKQLADILS